MWVSLVVYACARGGATAAGALALAIALDAPTFMVFCPAPLAYLTIAIPRPVQAALLPWVVRSPLELTAANVVSGWVGRERPDRAGRHRGAHRARRPGALHLVSRDGREDATRGRLCIDGRPSEADHRTPWLDSQARTLIYVPRGDM